MNKRLAGMIAAGAVIAGVAQADIQTWNDSGPNNNWSTNEVNWAGGAAWTNGNSALFTGGAGTRFGETVDIAATVTVANVTFQTNGYVIADANNDGSLSVAGSPSVFTVVNAGDTGKVSAAIGGSGGIIKAGNGVLNLTGTNTYSDTTIVSNGILRLAPGVLQGLGTTGTGNETVVAAGATLDVNSSFTANLNEDFTIQGTGVGGIGAFINTGPTDYYNVGYRNLTLAGNATIGVYRRFDMSGSGTFAGNGFTFTKVGGAEMAVSRTISNSPIVINDGVFTIQAAGALGSTDYPTTLNGTGKLQAWGSYTIAERMFINGGTLSSSGDRINTFTLTGNLTLSNNVVLQTDVVPTNTLELAGVLDGSGGFTRSGSGFVVISGNANTYSGPSTVNNGSSLWVGRTVGGTGVLGTGTATNNGTLYANSAVLSSGTVVNNNSGSLYLNPPTLTVGRIVNVSGTVYGTSVVQAASGVVNASTWNSYSGSFGSSVVTNAVGGTLNLYTNQIVFGQFVNGGRLNLWQPISLSNPITFNGGTVYVGDTAGTLAFPGTITTVTSAVFDGTNTAATEISGKITGSGGIVKAGSGDCFITSDANDYTGPSVINSGSRLWVGKTVGGTGLLGSGAVTNSGTLYANSAVLSAGDVVNNNGTLYLNPPTLSVGRIVNLAGTVYGTSVVQSARGVVNSGTWNSYSGSFGSSVVTNAVGGTMNLYTNILTYGQFANGGTLSVWQSLTLSSPLTFIGGTVYVNDLSNTLALTGPVTLAGNASFSGTASSVTEVSGALSGTGGIIRSGDGWCYLTSDANNYSGPTTINGGKSLWVGKPGVLSTGRLGSGAVTNNGTLYLDHAGDYVFTKGCNGGGNTFVRYGANVAVSGGVSTNSIWRVGQGSLTLTNGALFCVYGELTVGDRANVSYPSAPTNMLAVVNVTDGCIVTPASITFGNDGTTLGGTITGILNQVGGLVRTTANTAEDNGIRLGHYPAARSFYNMMGGTLIVDKDWDLGCATDGNGWFNMTGGSVFTKRVMLNERDNAGGYGRLTVAGGTLTVGSLTGSTVALSNGICADATAPYLVELGGAGGTIRAVTNLWIPVTATLYGSGSNAITIDSQAWTVTMTNRLSGAGGLNKSGNGTLLLSGKNSFTGLTQVAAGTLVLGSATAVTNVPLAVAANAAVDLGGFAFQLAGVSGAGVVSNGSLTVQGAISPGTNGVGELTFALASAAPGGTLVVEAQTNGVCDVLHATGSLSLSGMSLQGVDNGQWNTHKTYTIIRCDGALSGGFSQVSLPSPWYVMYDYAAREVRLSAAVGTLIRLN